MKALIPFLLPLVVLIVLGVFFWQWLQNNSTQPSIDDQAASVQVTEVDQATTTELATGGVADVPTVEMTAPENAPEGAEDSTARIRYQIKDNMVSLLVLATMAVVRAQATASAPTAVAPEAETHVAVPATLSPTGEQPSSAPAGSSNAKKEEALATISSAIEQGVTFSVWLKPAGQDTLTKAFDLVEGKGGLMGTGSLPVSVLPLTIYIADTDNSADVPKHTWLQATIPAPTAQ